MEQYLIKTNNEFNPVQQYCATKTKEVIRYSRAEGLTSLFCDALSPHLFAFPLVHKPHGGKGTKNKRAHFYFMLVLKLLRNSETIVRE